MVDPSDPVTLAMIRDEVWRERSRVLAQDILDAAKDHGFNPEFNLVLDNAVGLLSRTSYRAGFEILAEAIRLHRAQKADDRCIFDDDKLYEALGDGIKCDRRVGSQAEMLESCRRFIKCRTEEGHWPTYAELEASHQETLAMLATAKAQIESLTAESDSLRADLIAAGGYPTK